jgi:phenylalanyl-tRNA synthetase beta chain
MKTPMRWLSAFVDTGLTARELSRQMTMAGLEAEKIEELGAGWDKVFVGHVTQVERHPDADRLVLATVEAGEHKLTVVTGAPNIAAGQNVALALAGARLIDGHSDSGEYKVLKPGTIRGIKSEGMVCSEKELGISDEHEGILVLPDDAPVGVPLREYLGDDVIEFEITPNLVHAFSVRGIAREAGALLDRPVTEQPALDASSLANNQPGLITIEAPDLCSRYMGIIFDGVEVGPSPAWLADRMKAAGLRPVNNLVDITNYVMLELGQPLHAFDLRDLAGERIVVRRATDGETFHGIDHIERTLNSDMLVIADAERTVGVAGVIGAVNSEVREDTTSILLEGANFNMSSIRQTARALKIRTDASARFERGLDPNLVTDAMLRAAHLILELCPNASIRVHADIYPAPVERRTITFAWSRIERVLGISYSEEQVLDVLNRLDMRPVIADGTITVSPPTYRHDVTIREDVIEEIARISGYDLLPETLPTGTTTEVRRDRIYGIQEQIRSALVSAGLYEAVTYPTVSANELAPFTLNDSDVSFATTVSLSDMLRVKNPLQSDKPYLRTTLIPSLINVVRENQKHSSGVHFFELAHGYLPTSPDELPNEVNLLGLVMSGSRSSLSRFDEHGSIDVFDAKGALESVFTRIGVTNWSVTPDEHPALHPGRSARITLGGQPIGWIGELRPDTAANLGLGSGRVAVAEVALDDVFGSIPERPETRVVQRFLPVQQDFAVIVDRSVAAADVENALRGACGPLASGFMLFDIYEGAQIGESNKSLAYRVTFTAPDRPLTDDDVARLRPKIEKSLKQRVNGKLRS